MRFVAGSVRMKPETQYAQWGRSGHPRRTRGTMFGLAALPGAGLEASALETSAAATPRFPSLILLCLVAAACRTRSRGTRSGETLSLGTAAVTAFRLNRRFFAGLRRAGGPPVRGIGRNRLRAGTATEIRLAPTLRAATGTPVARVRATALRAALRADAARPSGPRQGIPAFANRLLRPFGMVGVRVVRTSILFPDQPFDGP